MMSAVLSTHRQSVAPVSGNVLSDDKIGGLSDHGTHEFALRQMLVIHLTLSNNSSNAILPGSAMDTRSGTTSSRATSTKKSSPLPVLTTTADKLMNALLYNPLPP